MKNWIAGAPYRGDRDAIEVLNPATLAIVGDVEACDALALELAVNAARKAQPDWAADEAARCTALAEAAKILAEHRDEIAELISLEQGKPAPQAAREVAGCERGAVWYSQLEMHSEVLRDTDTQRIVAQRRPIGVIGVIAPWNFPVTILGMKVWAALRAGNTLVVKPAPTTPLSTLRIAELLGAVLPSGVFNTVTGAGELGGLMTTHPGIGKISFTGSTQTGKAVMAAGAETVKRLTLELGGNDPAILLDGVDLAGVAPALVRSAFYNAGQVCQAIKRVYVPRALEADLIPLLVKEANDFITLGSGQDPRTTVGPVNNAMQKDVVTRLVDAARAEGAEIHQVGTDLSADLPGYFVRPVVVSGVTNTSALVADEQFGPALPVVAYDNLDELIDHLNEEEYGLDASVWATDEGHALAVADRIRAGQVFVNSHAGPPEPEIPFGGVKGSGFGREMGRTGLDDVTELRILTLAKAVS